MPEGYRKAVLPNGIRLVTEAIKGRRVEEAAALLRFMGPMNDDYLGPDHELVHGTIQVKSRAGHGTQIDVRVPFPKKAK